MDLKLALHTKTWTVFNWLALIGGSIVVYFLFVALADTFAFLGFLSYKTAFATFSSPQFYATIGFVIFTVYFFDMMQLVIKKEFFTPLWFKFSSLVN